MIPTDIPAFPIKGPLSSDHLGMGLLDYFAAKALQGLLVCQDAVYVGYYSSPQHAARDAYEHAAAMLEVRKEFLGESK